MPLLLALLLLLTAARAAPASWPGAGAMSAMQVQVEVPPGALPPGPAWVRRAGDGGSLDHRVRVMVTAEGARTWLWVPYDLGTMGWEDAPPVVVESDAGPVFRTTGDDAQGGAAAGGPLGAPQLLGTPDQLVALSQGIVDAGATPVQAERAHTGLQVRSATPVPDCRALAQAPYVVADGTWQGEALVDCAARGSRVLLVTPTPPARLAGLPAGTTARWGLGLVAWAPGFGAVAGSVTTELAGGTGAAADMAQTWTAGLGAEPAPTEDETSPLAPAALVLLLVAYVGLIGPVGYLVGIRPRRPLVAWGWFPAVAGLGTVGAALVSLAWQTEPRLQTRRTTVVAPDGTGLQTVMLDAHTPYGRSTTVTLPWADADLGSAWPGHRFSSPLTPPRGPLRVSEDRVDHRLSIEGLISGTTGVPSLSWVAPVQGRRPPRVWRRGEQVGVRNEADRAVARGVALVDGRKAEFTDLAPGATVTLDLVDATPAWDPEHVYTWVDGFVGQATVGPTWPGSVRVAVELAPGGPPDLVTTPDRRVEDREILVMAGPLTEGAP